MPYIYSKDVKMRKGQDYAINGSYMDSSDIIYWIGIFDGHGDNQVINFIRNIKKPTWDIIIRKENPMLMIFEMLLTINTRLSGSTGIISIIYPTYIKCFSIGDSSVLIFKNAEKIYSNTPHNMDNPKELARLYNRLETHDISLEVLHSVPSICNSLEMGTKVGLYIRFGVEKIAMSQALGHSNNTGFCPEISVIPYNPEDKIRVVAFSDGIGDMLCISNMGTEDMQKDLFDLSSMTGDEILEKIENRWFQSWVFNWSEIYPPVELKYKPDQFDDLSVSIWDNYTSIA